MNAAWFSNRGAGDLEEAGIYQWLVDGVAVYTGQANNIARRLREYQGNLLRLQGRKPYRRSNPDGYRAIHRRLHAARMNNAPIEFVVVENCEARRLNERERHHESQMRLQAPLEDLRVRARAEASIVHAVLSGVEPANDDVRIWLRGGAVFWGDQHWFEVWGLNLPVALCPDAVASVGIKNAILQCGDIGREKFGYIRLQSFEDESTVSAITAWNGFLGDRLFGFFRDANNFRDRLRQGGWLLGGDRDLAASMAVAQDAELLGLWRSNLPRRPNERVGSN